MARDPRTALVVQQLVGQVERGSAADLEVHFRTDVRGRDSGNRHVGTLGRDFVVFAVGAHHPGGSCEVCGVDAAAEALNL